MSTKVTIAYAVPSEHGEDFHLYFDYSDFQVHLEIDGKEIPLPSRLQAWIYNVWRTWESMKGLYLQLSNPSLLYAPPVGALRRGSEDFHDW